MNVKINVGTRVIALYHEKPEDQGSFYAGIIAEPPKVSVFGSVEMLLVRIVENNKIDAYFRIG